MIRSISTINRSMNVLQEKQENASANIANISTPGYKFQNIIASTLESHNLINHQGGPHVNRRVGVGGFIFGNQIDEVYSDFSQGNLYETEKATDFALDGRGFFTIRMDNGTLAYTRNGNFRLNHENELVTLEGYHVLGRDGNGNIGIIYGDENHIHAGEVLITDFNEYRNLRNLGETLYEAEEAGFIMESPFLRQGYLEMSNVHIGDELVRLIEISREFESHQKLIHAADETLSKAVNEVGRV